MANSTSLDESVERQVIYEYKIVDHNKVYKINKSAVHIIPTLAVAFENNSDLVELPIPHNRTINEFVDIIEFVDKYVKIWEADPTNENYIKIPFICTSNPSQFIRALDLKLIEDYIQERVPVCSDTLLRKYNINSICGPLLEVVYGFLGMTGLMQKICIYLATQMYSVSIEDIFRLESEAIFNSLNLNHDTEWNDENPGLQTHILTGDGRGCDVSADDESHSEDES